MLIFFFQQQFILFFFSIWGVVRGRGPFQSYGFFFYLNKFKTRKLQKQQQQHS